MRTTKKILVTRPAHQSENLCQLITLQGWQPVRFPVIDIHATSASEWENKCIDNISNYHYVFFVSVNAVEFALQRLNGNIEVLQRLKCVAVGKATARALEKTGISGILVPEQGFNTESVLAMADLQSMIGQNCLIFKGVGGRELLAESLIKRGAIIDYLEVYKRVLPVCDNRGIQDYIAKNELAAIVIYSGDALENLLCLLAKESTRQELLSIMLEVISQRVYMLAKQIGFKKIVVADQASDSAMIKAILNGEDSDRNN